MKPAAELRRVTANPDNGTNGRSAPVARSLPWRAMVVFLTVSALFALFYLLWRARIAILLIFAGVLVAVVLSSLCAFVETHVPLRRRWSLPLVLFTIAG